MQPEKTTKPLDETYEEERLRKWREKRAIIAEKSRQERLRQADIERQKRLEAFEEDKAKRVREAAEKRAEQDALQRAERMNAARAKIATRTDIDAARKRIAAYRVHAAKMLGLRLAMLVLAPTLLVAIYLFKIATPLYVAETKFSLSNTDISSLAITNSPFSSDPLSREAFHVQALITSPHMIDQLDRDDNFIDHFSAAEIDWVTRVKTPGLFIPSKKDQLTKFVSVSINAQEAMLELNVKATNPADAVRFSQTILEQTGLWLREVRQVSEDAPNPVKIISPPAAEQMAVYPEKLQGAALAFLFFGGLYAVGSIFLRTLLRHAYH